MIFAGSHNDGNHAAIYVASETAPPDPNVYLTDDAGLLLTDENGDLIVEG